MSMSMYVYGFTVRFTDTVRLYALPYTVQYQ